MTPHAPQFAGSSAVSTHELPQVAKAAAHREASPEVGELSSMVKSLREHPAQTKANATTNLTALLTRNFVSKMVTTL